MIEIKCIKTKKGNKCLVLVVGDVYCSFDEMTICKVAKSFGRLGDVLSLNVDERVILREE